MVVNERRNSGVIYGCDFCCRMRCNCVWT